MLALLIALTAVLPLSPLDDAPPADPGWIMARPAVDGLVVEIRADGSEQRLRRYDAELCRGDGRSVQAALVAALRERHGDGHFNLTLPTLGGTQFWADVRWDGGWRIQQHALTGHHRLLDPDDVRRAWGTSLACRAALEQRRLDGEVDAAPRHLVLLLHGLGRSRRAMSTLGARLREQGFATATVAYPSTRADIGRHAATLNALIDGLEGVERVSFVTHSLGGIVVRRALAEPAPWRERVDLGRVVMLAPPSRGSALARALQDIAAFDVAFDLLMGPAGDALAQKGLDGLPAPPCEFGIVAAQRGTPDGLNPLVPGDDDGIVGVEEALLPGASDTLIVHGLHTVIMNDLEVTDATARFLRTGRFGAGGAADG